MDDDLEDLIESIYTIIGGEGFWPGNGGRRVQIS